MHRADLRRFLILCALAALGLSAAVGCTLVGDSLTGVSLEGGRHSSRCLRKCREKAEWRTYRELARHLRAKSKCHKKDAGSERKACLAAERERHEAALERIRALRLECSNRCHHQQGGGGRDRDKDDDDDDDDDKDDDAPIGR